MKLPSCDSLQNHTKFQPKPVGQHFHPAISGILNGRRCCNNETSRQVNGATKKFSVCMEHLQSSSHDSTKCLCLCTLQLDSIATAFQSNRLSSQLLKSCCFRISFRGWRGEWKTVHSTYTAYLYCWHYMPWHAGTSCMSHHAVSHVQAMLACDEVETQYFFDPLFLYSNNNFIILYCHYCRGVIITLTAQSLQYITIQQFPQLKKVL